MAIYRERYTMATEFIACFNSQLVALRLLINHKKNGEFNEKEYQLLKNISDEMGSCMDNFVVGGLKNDASLTMENLNECIEDC